MESANKLNAISEKMDAIGKTMKEEADIYEAELSDRKNLGLTGDAVTHYNEWMERHGMEHLKVK